MPSTDLSSDDELAGHAEALLAALTTHLPGWVERTLAERLGPAFHDEVLDPVRPAVDQALGEIASLLRADIDRQRANPLAIVRSLVDPMTRQLDDAGIARPTRDPDAVRLFPGDHHDISPAAFSDIHPDLHLPGLTWGAAKAHVHLQRRRAEGRRQ